MKKIAIALTLFILSLSFSACRKINYEEGDKLPRRKFLETINGVWEIKHAYISIDANTYTEDSVSFWNTRFGAKGTLTIEYYNSLELRFGSHINYSFFSKTEDEVGYAYFRAYESVEKMNKSDTAFNKFSNMLIYHGEISILRLDKNNLILTNAYSKHGDRLELVKY